MPKVSSHPEIDANDPRRLDWFFPAITAEGGVYESLSSVIDPLKKRLSFAHALRDALTPQTRASVDAISYFSQRIKELQNTLDFRLGVLQPDREAAWFRTPTSKSAVPFASSSIMEPVFAPYDRAKADEVKRIIQRSWVEKKLPESNLFPKSPNNLWQTLLLLNINFEHIIVLKGDFGVKRLDTLPDGLPPEVESPALRAFLTNVKGAVKVSQEKLHDCFKKLWEASLPFWEYQKSSLKDRQHASSHFGDKEHTRDNTKNNFRENIRDTREEFKRRRQTRQAEIVYGYAREALKFMGFQSYPTLAELRKRYLDLAKKFHPDRHGGSDDAFKNLTKAYEFLQEKVHR